MAGTDYTGRTNDLLIMQGTALTGDKRIFLKIGDTARITTGVQKVAQTFLIELLTIRGSVVGDSTAGCNFVSDIQKGRLRTEADVQAYFSLAANQILARLRRNWETEESDAKIPVIPSDERLTSVTLLSFSITDDTLLLRVRLRTAAGTSREIFYPIPVPTT